MSETYLTCCIQSGSGGEGKPGYLGDVITSELSLMSYSCSLQVMTAQCRFLNVTFYLSLFDSNTKPYMFTMCFSIRHTFIMASRFYMSRKVFIKLAGF